jgi:hypothetical protein
VAGDQKFESAFLQRRVNKLSVPAVEPLRVARPPIPRLGRLLNYHRLSAATLVRLRGGGRFTSVNLEETKEARLQHPMHRAAI